MLERIDRKAIIHLEGHVFEGQRVSHEYVVVVGGKSLQAKRTTSTKPWRQECLVFYSLCFGPVLSTLNVFLLSFKIEFIGCLAYAVGIMYTPILYLIMKKNKAGTR